jgi:hypothetical protein
VQIEKQAIVGRATKATVGHVPVVVAVVNGEWTFVSVDGGSWRWFSSSKWRERER